MLVVRGQGLIEALRGEAELETGGAGPLDAFVVAAEVNTVGPERDRCFDVVVDDERDAGPRAEVPEGPTFLDELRGRKILQPQLDQSRAAVDRGPGDLVVVDERVQDHVSFARSSSVAGSSP